MTLALFNCIYIYIYVYGSIKAGPFIDIRILGLPCTPPGSLHVFVHLIVYTSVPA